MRIIKINIINIYFYIHQFAFKDIQSFTYDLELI